MRRCACVPDTGVFQLQGSNYLSYHKPGFDRVNGDSIKRRANKKINELIVSHNTEKFGEVQNRVKLSTGDRAGEKTISQITYSGVDLFRNPGQALA